MPNRSLSRILVAGGTGFLGFRVVRALLDEGAEVTVLLRPEQEEKLGVLRASVQVAHGDVWNPASLRGRARGHGAAIHLIGGMKQNSARGLTFRHLNFVSARNVAQMAVNDGVPHCVLLSAVAAPGVPSGYLEAKREAERYLQKCGLAWTIIHAPPLYVPNERRSLIGLLLSLFGALPLIGLPLTNMRPLAAELAARAIARLALSADSFKNRLISPAQLRQIGFAAERRLRQARAQSPAPHESEPLGDDEPPFGWLPPAH
ncbi:MAG: NAD-dependent epimerase/dehydratase family protein [Chloroflexi bacterium CFX4]|nr:NAD-dependent epimerase/dehydratase family protein [Chloroflexi bacterium CFX4]MDL1921390.1 NAD-dependent epimerase/dehydratase family protein [Chloroflexi bacterium CFX3]